MKKLKVTIEAQEAKTIYVPIVPTEEWIEGTIDEDDLYYMVEPCDMVEDKEEVWNKGANILLDNIKWNAEIVEENKDFSIMKVASDFALEALGEEQFNNPELLTARQGIEWDFIQGWNYAINHFGVDPANRWEGDVE